jgi:hypothetical protein
VYSPCNAYTGSRCAGERDGEQVAPPAGHTRPSKSQGTVPLIQIILHREIIHRGVEGLYCKRPIQCLASLKTLTPTPSPTGECVPPLPLVRGKDHSLGGEGVGVNISEDARHCSVLYICKYFVHRGITSVLPGVLYISPTTDYSMSSDELCFRSIVS